MDMEIDSRVIGVTYSVCAAMLLVSVGCYVVRHTGSGKAPPMPRGKVSIAGFGLIDAIGISIFAGFYVLSWIASLMVEEQKELGEMGNLPALLLSQLAFQLFQIVIVLGLLFWRMNLAAAFGLVWRRWVLVFLAPLVVVMVWALMGVLDVVGYFDWISELVDGDLKQDAVKLLAENDDPMTLGAMALVACWGAPLAEEVVFRGYIYAAMKRFSNIPVAVIFTGILFGAVHMNLAALLPLTVLGIFLALAYEYTGSLWAPIAIHFCFNSATTVSQMIMKLNPELLEQIEQNAAYFGFG